MMKVDETSRDDGVHTFWQFCQLGAIFEVKLLEFCQLSNVFREEKRQGRDDSQVIEKDHVT